MKATVSGVFEDLKFKISEDLDQNWSCPESALLAVSVSGWAKQLKKTFLTLIILVIGKVHTVKGIQLQPTYIDKILFNR